MIYLDHSATSPLLPAARAAMIDAMDNLIGNPSALHTPGHQTHDAIELARARIARLINAEPKEIIFTSGGSESNNTVVNIFTGKNIAISNIEHPSLLESARARTKANLLPVDKTGRIISLPERNNIELYSIMTANNELGTINDIANLAAAAHARNALFHTDATQALGKIPIDVKDMDVDYLTATSHKIGGPVGVGILYVKTGAPFTPFIVGGHQERSRRAGTYPVINIVGFGAAADHVYHAKEIKAYNTTVKSLRNQLANRITKDIPHAKINHPLEHSLPHILNVSFAASEGESIQLYLDALGDIIVSTGSACAAGDGKPSHVLMALYDDAEVAHSSIRFSLGLDTTANDIDQVMRHLPLIISRLQQISTIKINQELVK